MLPLLLLASWPRLASGGLSWSPRTWPTQCKHWAALRLKSSKWRGLGVTEAQGATRESVLCNWWAICLSSQPRRSF